MRGGLSSGCELAVRGWSPDQEGDAGPPASRRGARHHQGGTKLYPWVQGLRAIAAFSVAFVHTSNDAITGGRDPSGLIQAASDFMPWVAGVDIFFVISGFVIIHASARLFATRTGPRRFLRRRLTRIVPLYWALTTLFLAIALLQRSAVHGDTGGIGYVLASYLFIPWPRPGGVMEPVLGLGWTLNYEMFFYLVLTPLLLLPRGWAVLGSSAALCSLVAADQSFGFGVSQLRFWADPIILEFVLGMGLALAVASGLALPRWLRLTMVTAACVTLHFQAGAPPAWRMISFGVPAGLLVAAAVSGKRPDRTGPAMRALIRLGDASYALYLFHPFVMRGFTLLGSRLGAHSEASGIVYVTLSLAVAQLSALAINAGFERKLAAMLAGRGMITG